VFLEDSADALLEPARGTALVVVNDPLATFAVRFTPAADLRNTFGEWTFALLEWLGRGRARNCH